MGFHERVKSMNKITMQIYIYITFEENSEYYTSEDDIDMIDVIVFAKLWYSSESSRESSKIKREYQELETRRQDCRWMIPCRWPEIKKSV